MDSDHDAGDGGVREGEVVEEGAAEEQVAEQVEEPEEGKGHQAVVEHRAVLRAQLVRGAAVPALLVDGEQQRERNHDEQREHSTSHKVR